MLTNEHHVGCMIARRLGGPMNDLFFVSSSWCTACPELMHVLSLTNIRPELSNLPCYRLWSYTA